MVPLSDLLYALVIAGWIGGFGLLSARLASRVERRAALWFLIGAIVGPVALLVLRTAPPGRCRTCGTPTRGWNHICWWCHEDVRSTPASTLEILERMSTRVAPPELVSAPPALPRPEPARPFVIRTEPVRPSTTDHAESRPQATPRTHPVESRPRATPQTPAQPQLRATPSATRQKLSPSEMPAIPPIRHIEGNGSPGSVGEQLATARATPSQPLDGAVRVLATAVFVAGGPRLVPGHRYGLAVRSSRLLVLGPTDVDPDVVVLDRAAADVEIRSVEGRLIVSEPRSGSGLVLAFMSVAGASPDDLASLVHEAARPTARG